MGIYWVYPLVKGLSISPLLEEFDFKLHKNWNHRPQGWQFMGFFFSLKNVELVGKHMSHEKHPGWLGFIGDYTIQLYGDYNKLL